MNRQAGSAIAEALVGLLALLPAFYAIDYLGRLHDMQRANVAAAVFAIHVAETQVLNTDLSIAESKLGGADSTA